MGANYHEIERSTQSFFAFMLVCFVGNFLPSFLIKKNFITWNKTQGYAIITLHTVSQQLWCSELDFDSSYNGPLLGEIMIPTVFIRRIIDIQYILCNLIPENISFVPL